MTRYIIVAYITRYKSYDIEGYILREIGEDPGYLDLQYSSVAYLVRTGQVVNAVPTDKRGIMGIEICNSPSLVRISYREIKHGLISESLINKFDCTYYNIYRSIFGIEAPEGRTNTIIRLKISRRLYDKLYTTNGYQYVIFNKANTITSHNNKIFIASYNAMKPLIIEDKPVNLTELTGEKVQEFDNGNKEYKPYKSTKVKVEPRDLAITFRNLSDLSQVIEPAELAIAEYIKHKCGLPLVMQVDTSKFESTGIIKCSDILKKIVLQIELAEDMKGISSDTIVYSILGIVACIVSQPENLGQVILKHGNYSKSRVYRLGT